MNVVSLIISHHCFCGLIWPFKSQGSYESTIDSQLAYCSRTPAFEYLLLFVGHLVHRGVEKQIMMFDLRLFNQPACPVTHLGTQRGRASCLPPHKCQGPPFHPLSEMGHPLLESEHSHGLSMSHIRRVEIGTRLALLPSYLSTQLFHNSSALLWDLFLISLASLLHILPPNVRCEDLGWGKKTIYCSA